MSSFFSRALLLALASVLVAVAPAGAAKPLKAPAGLAFYKPPSPLPAGKHGDVIWSRRIADPLRGGSRTHLVLYRSTSLAGRPIAVSGTVTLPRGKAPRGGWPVISWGHGTTGIADVCAPSRAGTNPYVSYVSPQLEAWLRRGYAIARTDFEGLGTPGAHPFLIGRSEGRGMIDIVRAARRLDARVGRRWISAGHSQGGHAALFAGTDGPSWAPDLRLRGVAAFAPASQIGTQARGIGTLTQPSAVSGLAALIVEGASAADSAVKPGELLSDPALAFRPDIARKCLAQLGAADSFGGLAPAELVRQGADLSALLRVLDAQNPDGRIRVPVLMLQGLSDGTVFSFFTDELNKQLAANGSRVEYRTYPGVSHGEIVAKAVARTNSWLRARLR